MTFCVIANRFQIPFPQCVFDLISYMVSHLCLQIIWEDDLHTHKLKKCQHFLTWVFFFLFGNVTLFPARNWFSLKCRLESWSPKHRLYKTFFIFHERKKWLQVKRKQLLTGQKVPDLLDQIPQVLIALVHLFFGGVGFQQNILSILFGLICPQFCFRYLSMKNKWPREHHWKAMHLEPWVLETNVSSTVLCSPTEDSACLQMATQVLIQIRLAQRHLF